MVTTNLVALAKLTPRILTTAKLLPSGTLHPLVRHHSAAKGVPQSVSFTGTLGFDVAAGAKTNASVVCSASQRYGCSGDYTLANSHQWPGFALLDFSCKKVGE